MKKRLLLIALLPLIGIISGCGDNPDQSLIDSDFDGLVNSIDPNPLNNIYDFHLYNSNHNDDKLSNSSKVTVDYRDIVNYSKDVDRNLARLSALIISDTTYEKGYIENNRYVSKDSKSAILTQIGCQDIKIVALDPNDYQRDFDDVGYLLLGHHLFYDGNKKTNVFFAGVNGYVTDGTGWRSNFDVGADTKAYYDINGTPTEWGNKKHHKGFDIAANRCFDKIVSYMNEHKIDGVDNFILLSGHSRAAAISSLLGVKFKDNNYNSLVYAFESPRQVCDTPKEDLEKYDNIFSIINTDDFVDKVPCSAWNNFSHYGKVYTYSTDKHREEYKQFFIDKEYPKFDVDTRDSVIDALASIADDRNDIYEYNPHDEDERIVKEEGFLRTTGFATEQEANEKIQEITNSFLRPDVIKNLIKMEVAKLDEDENQFQINYCTKPAVIVSLIDDVFYAQELGKDVKSIITPYVDFLSRYITPTIPAILNIVGGLPDSIQIFGESHALMQNVFATPFIGEK